MSGTSAQGGGARRATRGRLARLARLARLPPLGRVAAIALVAVAVLLGGATLWGGAAHAASAPGTASAPGLLQTAAAQAVGAAGSADAEHALATGHHVAGQLKNGPVTAFFFWLFALMTVGGALFVITRKNLVAAVMGLVATFFAIAALYAMLYAHFLAVIQVLVYAGAIMVLFVFVVMILNREEDQPWSVTGLFGKGVAGLALLYLFIRLVRVLWTVKDSAAAALPPPGAHVSGGDFGSTHAVGRVLFHHYLFPFEAVSVVLLIAVVGAIAVARPHQPRDTSDGGADASAPDSGDGARRS